MPKVIDNLQTSKKKPYTLRKISASMQVGYRNLVFVRGISRNIAMETYGLSREQDKHLHAVLLMEILIDMPNLYAEYSKQLNVNEKLECELQRKLYYYLLNEYGAYSKIDKYLSSDARLAEWTKLFYSNDPTMANSALSVENSKLTREIVSLVLGKRLRTHRKKIQLKNRNKRANACRAVSAPIGQLSTAVNYYDHILNQFESDTAKLLTVFDRKMSEFCKEFQAGLSRRSTKLCVDLERVHPVIPQHFDQKECLKSEYATTAMLSEHQQSSQPVEFSGRSYFSTVSAYSVAMFKCGATSPSSANDALVAVSAVGTETHSINKRQ